MELINGTNIVKTNILFKAAFVAAVVCLMASLVIVFTVGLPHSGPLLIAFLLLLGISFQGSPRLKGFTYSTMIFAAVATALS